MQRAKISLIAAVFAVTGLASSAALADRWHDHSRVYFDVHVGGPRYWYGPPAYYYPPYYYPPVVAVPVAPPAYVERNAPDDDGGGDNYWYYCTDSKAYYPYVKDCPGGWQRVAPRPPTP